LFRGHLRQELRREHVRAASRFVEDRSGSLGRAVGRVLGAATRDTLVEGVQATAMVLERVREGATVLSEVGRVGKIVQLRQAEVERLRMRSGQQLANNVSARLLDRLADVPIEDARVGQLVAEIGEEMDADWWMAERLIRTETSFAYNSAQADGLELVIEDAILPGGDPELRGVRGRWTEMVDDFTGRPFDKRVGLDSMAMHGQVAAPGRYFYAPARSPVQGEWLYPPNRPNDRAVLTPWLPDWGVPGWSLRGGELETVIPRLGELE
jgi:hypothetical protein